MKSRKNSEILLMIQAINVTKYTPPVGHEIRHGTDFEDADILCHALSPAAKGGRLLSIASAGDNVLALLTLDPKEIVAADFSWAQLACLELRMAAFKKLSHDALLKFLGVLPCDDRVRTYQQLSPSLSEKSRAFWDAHFEDIAHGIIHIGAFEQYLQHISQNVLPWIHSKSKMDQLLKPQPVQQQALFYQEQWNTWLWKLLFTLYFNRQMMIKMGHTSESLGSFKGNFPSQVRARVGHSLTRLAACNNPYLTYALTGNYNVNALPRYLRANYKDVITSRLDRITLVHGPVQTAGTGKFDGYNLSDIFGFMNDDEFQASYEHLYSRANIHARFVYWSSLIPRIAPASMRSCIKTMRQLSSDLFFQDKGWFYNSFIVEEVIQ